MRPLILLSTVPDGAITRLNLEVFDSARPVGETCVYRFTLDAGVRPDSRPDWSAQYAARLLRVLANRLEAEVSDDGPSMHQSGMVRQASIQRPAPRLAPAEQFADD